MFSILNYIKNYNGSDFINVPKLIEKVDNLILITPRNIGKSFSSYFYVIEQWYLSKKEFVIVRLSKEELYQSDITSTFYYVIQQVQLKYNDDPIFNTLKVLSTGIWIDKVKIAAFVYFSKASNTKSQGSLNNVGTIIFDEFLNTEIVIANYIIKWADLYKSFQRNNLIKTIFLGNKNNNIENDYMTEFAIDFDLNNPDNQYVYLENRSLLAVLINKTIKHPSVIKSQEQFEKLFKNTPVEQFTKGGCIKSTGIKNIYSWNFYNVEKTYKQLFAIKFLEQFFIMGRWEEKNWFYIKEVNYREEINCPIYFYNSGDCEMGLIDIKRTGTEDLLKQVYNIAHQELVYSTIAIRELFLNFLSIAGRIE